MHIRVHYQGFGESHWMDQLFTRRLSKLERYLGPTAQIDLFLSHDEKCYFSKFVIHHKKQHFVFSSSGYNLYESFSLTCEKAVRELSNHKRKIKEKFLRKLGSRDEVA